MSCEASALNTYKRIRFLTTIETQINTSVFCRMSGALQKRATTSPFHLPGSPATVRETTAYTDVVEMQKMLLLVYIPLPILLAMLVSEVQ